MKISENTPTASTTSQVSKQYSGNQRPAVNHQERLAVSKPGARSVIEKWDNIPQADFVQRVAGEFVLQHSQDLCKNKKVVIFSLPGAFTPTCSEKQLPGYEEMYDRFKQAGVDEVYCVSVNDGFVMNAWAESLGIKNVKLLADGNADFTDSMGMLCTKRAKGFANRSWRYAIYVVNGIVQQAYIEPGFNHNDEDDDPYTCTDPETMIQHIEAENR
jgi:peroxiredoxin